MKKNQPLYLLLFLCFVTINLHAQTEPPFFDLETSDYTLLGSELEFKIPEPPPEPVRAMAEWEELESVVISWQPIHSDPAMIPGRRQVLKDIIKYAKDEVNVIVICSDVLEVQDTLTNSGIDWSTNVTFVEEITNSIWIRDYGPNTVYTNDVHDKLFVDWIYNRPRPADDIVPDVISDLLSVPVYNTTVAPFDLVNTGGNFMSDGMGKGFSSKLVLSDNGPLPGQIDPNHTEEEIDSIMHLFMGIDEYIKMDKLAFDSIHHIDMHMKLLDEETILVGQYPSGISDGPQIEANIQYILDNFTTSFGNPFNVVRIPMPPDFDGSFPPVGSFRTYTNAIILNKLILIPFYEEQFDTTAQRIWEELMPGYKIQGINSNALIEGFGAIHCITKEVGINNPLLINTARVRAGCEGIEQPVEAFIKHQSGIASVELFYSVDTTLGYENIPMDFTTDNKYSANIPAQVAGTEVFYYIHAIANNGKEISRPLPAPEAYFHYSVMPIMDCTVGDENVLLEGSPLGTIYPNPSSTVTVIPVNLEVSIDATINVTDVLGRVVETIYEGELPSGESYYYFDTNKFSSGTYFISLKTDEHSVVQKLIIN